MVAKQAWNIVQNPNSWRIGSGDNIRVMHDPWMRGSVDRWVPSPQPAAKRILETPLVSSVREDKVVWEEEKNGCYSVKSGYKLAMRYMIGSDKHHVAGNWNGIWKAQAPHKARHLLWRLCRGCLPTRCRLLERCAVARDSWCAAGLSSVLHNAAYQQSNAMDRIFAVCSNESSDTVGRVAMLLWSIWHNLHKLQSNSVSGTTVAVLVRWEKPALGWVLLWSIWHNLHKLQSNSVSGTTVAVLVRWEKPALGWVKCNVDVALLPGSGRTSVGVCFRDNSGQFMAGMTQ
ncbi:hypothetical protein TSUD_223900 [Trifolium subterraneum]|uniref:Reverse transcriptase zinc-binding domain-containing protein n=1 Tax=Trifolium subterraneum TaxID=3900 RepID=A0A2Z6MB22_TRISU|nr:hypothetical protein TSUD_223900 [Trifolium subterraneum]